MTGTAIITAKDGEQLGAALRKAQGSLVSLLGSRDMAIRAWKVAYVLVRRTPDLQECTVESIVNGMLQSAQFGLELGVEAYLVPFKNKETGQKEAVFIADWKGLVRLAIRTGSLTGGHADLVYKADDYACQRSESGVVFRHERQRFGKRAAIDTVKAHVEAGCQGVYFIGYPPAGPPVTAEMPVSEVEYVRKTYSRQADGPLWSKRWSAGACKTVTKQGLKLVRMTPMLQQAIELDNRYETGIQTAVLNGDEKAVEPYREPKPLSAGDEEAQVRNEDAELAKE